MTDRADGEIRYEKDSETHIARITIDNPAMRNAYTAELRDDITRALDDVINDDAIKVVVLRGAGGMFCSGADMNSAYRWYETPGDDRRPSQRRRLTVDREKFNFYREWNGFPKATVVALDGLAFGGGLELALGADICVAGRSAKVGMPAARFLGPILGTLHLFFHRFGPVLSKRLLLTGDVVTIEEIAAPHLFTEIVDDDRVQVRADYWAAKIAKMPADGITLAKEAYRLVESQNGMAGEEVSSYLFHTMGTNLRFEPDEFNFVKTRAQHGARDAFRMRDEHFAVEEPE